MNNNPNVPNQYPVSGTKKSGAGQIIIFAVIAILIIVLSVVLIFVLRNKQNNNTDFIEYDYNQPPPPPPLVFEVSVNGGPAQFGCYLKEDMRYVSLTGFCDYVGFTYKVDGNVYTITPLMGEDTKLNVKDKKFERTEKSGELSKIEILNTGDVYVLARELGLLFENVQAEYIAETGVTNITVPGFVSQMQPMGQPPMGQPPMGQPMPQQAGAQPQAQQPEPANNQQSASPEGNQQPPQGNAPEGQPPKD